MAAKKALIVLCSDIYIRNYITTDALEDIEKSYDCHYLVSGKIANTDALKEKNNVGFYSVNKKLDRAHHSAFNVVMWRFRRLSSAFGFRFRRKFDIPVSWKDANSIASVLRYLAMFIVRKARVVTVQVLGSRLIFPLYKRFVIDRIAVNADLEKKVVSTRPDIIIYTSAAYDSEGTDLVRIGRKHNILTLFLIDNWDNLSSKTVMLERPDFITVWGQQNLEHAKRIHGFSENQVFLIGTPRFDEYFRQRKVKQQSHFDRPYALFLGCAIPFDEATALQILDQEIESGKDTYGDLAVVYRPHPWRQGKDSIVGLNLKNIIIDPQVEPNYLNNKGVKFQPPLHYYPSLLSNAEFVTGPLTSMLIEAQIFYRKVLAIVYYDGKNITSPNNALKYYPHFEGLSKLEGMTFCNDKKSLGKDFRQVWANLRNTPVNKERLDEQRRYYLFDNEDPYKVRLLKIVRKVMAEENVGESVGAERITI